MPYALHYLEAYHARYPKVEFYIRLGSPQDLLNDLDRGELHVLFLRRSTQESGSLHERILGEDALELIMTAATDPRGAGRRAHRAAARRADVPAALGRPLGLQRLSDEGVPPQRL